MKEEAKEDKAVVEIEAKEKIRAGVKGKIRAGVKEKIRVEAKEEVQRGVYLNLNQREETEVDQQVDIKEIRVEVEVIPVRRVLKNRGEDPGLDLEQGPIDQTIAPIVRKVEIEAIKEAIQLNLRVKKERMMIDLIGYF
jgi:hypothetical protein